jgi:hypothetical protein
MPLQKKDKNAMVWADSWLSMDYGLDFAVPATI